jgi:D-alanine-D-alanine ligase
MLGLPFTGPDAVTLAVTLDKSLARRVVTPDVPVADGVLVDGEDGEAQLGRLRYPVLVKPNHEGSSKGIDSDSVCADPLATASRCRWVRDRYDGPALAEEFLPGAEVTVGVQGNRSSARILGMMEIAAADSEEEPFVYTIEAKRAWRERTRYYSPPRLPARAIEAIRSHALTAYRLLGCRDLARLDFRLDAAGSPTFLECNALPGLDPDNSDIVILSRGCIPYDTLVQQVLLEAAQRHGVRLP